MYANNAFNTYKNNSVTHASKEQLLLMLVDGAVRFSKIAREGLEQNDLKKSHTNLLKTQDIFTELMASIDTSSGDWAVQMFNVYAFIKERLGVANLTKDVKVLDEVMPLIQEVRDIWYECERRAKGKR